MKTLIFKNGGTVDFVECYGNQQYIQGAQREVLDFRFDPVAISLDEADKLFTVAECARLTIRETTIVQVQAVDEAGNAVLDEEGNPVMETVERVEEFVHENYGVRVALSKQHYTLATENGAEDVEQISVKLAQWTPTELQVASLSATMDILVTESLMA